MYGVTSNDIFILLADNDIVEQHVASKSNVCGEESTLAGTFSPKIILRSISDHINDSPSYQETLHVVRNIYQSSISIKKSAMTFPSINGDSSFESTI